jgi:hypothetical protein
MKFDAAMTEVVAVAKSAPRSYPRAFWYQAIRKGAARIREPHESMHKAVSRYISRGDGQALAEAMRVAGGPSYIIEKEMNDLPTNFSGGGVGPGFSSGDGLNNARRGRHAVREREDDTDQDCSFTNMVDDAMNQNPTMKRSHAIDAVRATPRGAAALRKERELRISKALRL